MSRDAPANIVDVEALAALGTLKASIGDRLTRRSVSRANREVAVVTSNHTSRFTSMIAEQRFVRPLALSAPGTRHLIMVSINSRQSNLRANFKRTSLAILL